MNLPQSEDDVSKPYASPQACHEAATPPAGQQLIKSDPLDTSCLTYSLFMGKGEVLVY
jgi:hypothetical protein